MLARELREIRRRAVAVGAVAGGADFRRLRLARVEVGRLCAGRKCERRDGGNDEEESAVHHFTVRGEAALGVVRGDVGHVLVGQRRGDRAHRRMAALAGLVFLERLHDVGLVLAGDPRHLVDLGKRGAPAFDAVATLAHLDLLRALAPDRRRRTSCARAARREVSAASAAASAAGIALLCIIVGGSANGRWL